MCAFKKVILLIVILKGICTNTNSINVDEKNDNDTNGTLSIVSLDTNIINNTVSNITNSNEMKDTTFEARPLFKQIDENNSTFPSNSTNNSSVNFNDIIVHLNSSNTTNNTVKINTTFDADINSTIYTINNDNKTIMDLGTNINVNDTFNYNSTLSNDTLHFNNDTNMTNLNITTLPNNITEFNNTTPSYSNISSTPIIITVQNTTIYYNISTPKPAKNVTRKGKNSSNTLGSLSIQILLCYYLVLYYV